MTKGNRDWLDWIKKAPGWLTGLITLITALAGFFKLWQGDAGLMTIALLVLGVGGGTLGCAYLAFKQTPPLVAGGKGTWQYPRWRRWALVGLVIIPLLATATVGFLKLWRGDTGLVTIVLLIVSIGGGISGCFYIAFKRGPRALVIGARPPFQHPTWRRWALTGLVIIPLLAVGGLAHFYQQTRSPDKVIILIANFEGPEPQNYRVTETVLARLRAALEPYDDVLIEPLGRAITEAEGSAVARAAGEEHKATIVIWGWYGATEEAVPLSVHFELLHSPEYMPVLGAEAQGQVQTMAAAELESFALQTRLSEEMAYLSLFTVGVARYEAGDLDGAIACFSDALSQTVELVPALSQSQVYYYRASAYLSKEDYDRAIADYDQVIQLQPNCGVCTYNDRGNAYLAKGDYNHAIIDYNQAIQIQPDFAAAYSNRGLAYADKGDYDRAIADYDQAIQIQPDFAMAYSNRGLAYANRGDYDRAIADYDQAIQIQPDFAMAYYHRGNAHVYKGNYARAITDLDQVVHLQPDDAASYFARGGAYYFKGDYDRAIADFSQAIQLDPDCDTCNYKFRGYAYYEKGDYDLAIADFNQVIQIQPDSADAFFRRGRAYIQKGEEEKAISDFSKVLELTDDPDLQQQAEEQLQMLGE